MVDRGVSTVLKNGGHHVMAEGEKKKEMDRKIEKKREKEGVGGKRERGKERAR